MFRSEPARRSVACSLSVSGVQRCPPQRSAPSRVDRGQAVDLTICRGMLLLEREGCSIRAQIAAASRVSLQTYPRAGADFTVRQATAPDSVDRARQRFQLHTAQAQPLTCVSCRTPRPLLLRRPAQPLFGQSGGSPTLWRRATQSVTFASADWQRSSQTSFPGAG